MYCEEFQKVNSTLISEGKKKDKRINLMYAKQLMIVTNSWVREKHGIAHSLAMQ